MPQVKMKVKTQKITAAKRDHKQSNESAYELITKMLEYESAAQREGIDLTTGRFEMLTASERQYYRAELIADYIRLSAANMGDSQGYFDAALADFCKKICDMKIPSHELIGTYMAAVDLSGKEESLDVPGLKDAIKSTMIIVLQSCVAEMEHRAKLAA